jgi:hypothetical protein
MGERLLSNVTSYAHMVSGQSRVIARRTVKNSGTWLSRGQPQAGCGRGAPGPGGRSLLDGHPGFVAVMRAFAKPGQSATGGHGHQRAPLSHALGGLGWVGGGWMAAGLHAGPSSLPSPQAGRGGGRGAAAQLGRIRLHRITIVIPGPQGGFMEWKKSIKVFTATLRL